MNYVVDTTTYEPIKSAPDSSDDDSGGDDDQPAVVVVGPKDDWAQISAPGIDTPAASTSPASSISPGKQWTAADWNNPANPASPFSLESLSKASRLSGEHVHAATEAQSGKLDIHALDHQLKTALVQGAAGVSILVVLIALTITAIRRAMRGKK
ncbi:hypothetical protein F6X40_35640 [Paraburkholderia sp. UCT31]|uniref:hypothetical protein n=1 Tax=Paraburkholderia sp. UCT31 TaxID=2615209 RepID=UPI0016550AAA|nr:hypothetical protein [Paraburkholderia sp. UCT31]MBC8741884.1 hypothetical protein [Paraburkholderia sp. UCT31]